jgi:hypothetical protein
MAYRRDWGQPQAGAQGFMRTAKVFGRKVNLATIDVSAGGGPIGMFRLPPFFMVLGAYGNCAKLDTGTVALTFNIGDAVNAARFAAASTIGQGGGAISTLAAAGLAFQTFTETEVLFAPVTPANVAAAGILEYYLWGAIFA